MESNSLSRFWKWGGWADTTFLAAADITTISMSPPMPKHEKRLEKKSSWHCEPSHKRHGQRCPPDKHKLDPDLTQTKPKDESPNPPLAKAPDCLTR